VKKLGSATDPLWYKDAVIYELHVRAFQDSNADGIGDFPGLLSRLDYLQDLGVTCLWLLPFFPSPLRDDGYDISDYTSVNPSYGTLDDFKKFLNAAHQRGMQVMIELVINHTSDQHPWFKRARLAPLGSPERDFYVWSSTDQLFKEVRIIFSDTEKSNWTWDETAKAYYWHRFFSHQPDLNYDNPLVMEEVLKAMRFWLDMGVDALRMDAIPYLLERDGTSCENLPETHAIIKRIRAAIDEEYAGRLILAEANQWPADVRPYFGDGDECHMAFHFPLMPRIYMALRQEDRLPITDIMAQTPAIPDTCQWGLFLRNHDELTLEMVTNDERDYMYFAYSADPRMRINVGIRRRLAPLVDNNRRRIELLNSLLFSFPGTPIIYYGDEIGMGDNIYLGDRNGVRTPMQWNPDRNAGFSTAVPAKLYFPVIMDPIWGYQAINVEAQQSDPSSLLHWNRNMIALRKLFRVFGRGTLEFLHPENRKVLAYIRHYDPSSASREQTEARVRDVTSPDTETVLCVANLSRFAQPVSLDLSEFAGMVPVEMLGYVPFPAVTAQPYALTLAPYSFLWLELQPAPEAPEPVAVEEARPAVDLAAATLENVLAGPGLEILERLLPSWLVHQRWFGAKTRTIQSARIKDSFRLDSSLANTAVVLVEINYDDANPEVTPDLYQLPLAITAGVDADVIQADFSQAVIARLTTPAGAAVVHDATVREDVRQTLLKLIAENIDISSGDATLEASSGTAFSSVRGRENLPARINTAEQSNTSILYDRRLILKLFRQLQSGENPDTEIGRFLTEVAHFPRIAPFCGEISITRKDEQPITVAMLQGLVENQGDGWQWTMEELARFYEITSSLPTPRNVGQPAAFHGNATVPEQAREHAGFAINAAHLLGHRTAEMHLALATPTDDPAFIAEPLTADDLDSDAARIETQIIRSLEALKYSMARLSDDTTVDAARILSAKADLLERAAVLRSSDLGSSATGCRIRIHGDYHLGQILRSHSDYVILDFEGEPARPLAERRKKQSPLRDVAGMLRSFSYAAFSALNNFTDHHPATSADQAHCFEAWATLWQNAISIEFLRGYRETIAARPELLPPPKEAQLLLGAYLLEKALYELLYELNNRPAWVRIPLAGILALPR
jgi:maltose alpha-D-glucosyltransferase/alpha-amylase